MMTHTPALILFNQPVNKVKNMPRLCSLPGPAARPCDDGGVELCDHPCRTAARRGVERAVNGRELRGPLAGDPARSNGTPPAETSSGPARCAPASRRRLKCSRLLVLRSGARERGASRIIIMLLWCHLQHKTEGELNIPPTCEKAFFFFFQSPSIELK